MAGVQCLSSSSSIVQQLSPSPTFSLEPVSVACCRRQRWLELSSSIASRVLEGIDYSYVHGTTRGAVVFFFFFFFFFFFLLVGFSTSQQHDSRSQGRICSGNCACCHTEIEAADQTFHLTQSQYTDTGPTSLSANPVTPGDWQGSRWSITF